MVDYTDGMKLFDTDMDAIELGIQGIGVLSGCVCSATGSDTSVSWTVGIVKTRTITRSIAASSLNLSSLQNSTYSRKVIIYVDDTDGNVKAEAGAAAAAYPVGNTGRNTWQPAPPDFSGTFAITEDDVVLAEIWLSKIGTVIASNDVSNRRVEITNPHIISDGLATEITQKITGASGQTANLFVVEVYGGTDKFVIDSDGDVTVTGNFTLTGSLAYTGEMVITGDTAATITLKITGASGQSADLLVVEQNDGTDKFKIAANGDLTHTGAQTLTGAIGLTGNLTQTGSQAVTGEVQITGDTAGTITTKITGASGQTADLFVVEKNDGTDAFRVDKDGKVYTPLSGADGSATVTVTNTYVVVTHGLAITPTLGDIQITPQGNLLGRTFWGSDVGATTFRINISTSDTIDHVFSWSVVI